MGRSWILPPLSNNSVYISNHLASHFNLGVGSTLIISLNLSAQFPHSFYSTFNNTNASYDLQEYISSNYTTVPTGIAVQN